jgi:hypothetical protein
MDLCRRAPAASSVNDSWFLNIPQGGDAPARFVPNPRPATTTNICGSATEAPDSG